MRTLNQTHVCARAAPFIVYVQYSTPHTLPRMDEEKQQILEDYLAFCQRVYERLAAQNEWPWPLNDDSPKSEEMIDSRDNS